MREEVQEEGGGAERSTDSNVSQPPQEHKFLSSFWLWSKTWCSHKTFSLVVVVRGTNREYHSYYSQMKCCILPKFCNFIICLKKKKETVVSTNWENCSFRAEVTEGPVLQIQSETLGQGLSLRHLLCRSPLRTYKFPADTVPWWS